MPAFGHNHVLGHCDRKRLELVFGDWSAVTTYYRMALDLTMRQVARVGVVLGNCKGPQKNGPLHGTVVDVYATVRSRRKRHMFPQSFGHVRGDVFELVATDVELRAILQLCSGTKPNSARHESPGFFFGKCVRWRTKNTHDCYPHTPRIARP